MSNIKELSASQLIPNTWQTRTVFDVPALQETADSLKRHGFIYPLVVTRSGNVKDENGEVVKDENGKATPCYMIIDGERRWRAAKMADIDTIPCIVRDADDASMAELNLVANAIRVAVGPIDEGNAIVRYMAFHKTDIDATATAFGLLPAFVLSRVRLVTELTDEAQEAIKRNDLPVTHAERLFGKTPAEQNKATKVISKKSCNLREFDGVLSRVQAGKTPEQIADEMQGHGLIGEAAAAAIPLPFGDEDMGYPEIEFVKGDKISDIANAFAESLWAEGRDDQNPIRLHEANVILHFIKWCVAHKVTYAPGDIFQRKVMSETMKAQQAEKDAKKAEKDAKRELAATVKAEKAAKKLQDLKAKQDRNVQAQAAATKRARELEEKINAQSAAVTLHQNGNV